MTASLFDNDLWGDEEPDYDQPSPAEVAHEERLNWHLRWVARLTLEREDTAAQFDDAIAQLRRRKEEVLISIDRKIGWHETSLEGYMRQLNALDKRNTSKKLAAGTLQLRKAQPVFQVTDEDRLLEWAEATHPDVVKVERTIRKNELKGAVQFQSGEPGSVVMAVDPVSGEQVPGLVVVHRQAGFSAKPFIPRPVTEGGDE